MKLGKVGGVKTDTILSGAGTVEVAKLCTSASAGGVCQMSRSDKTSVITSLQLRAVVSSLPLDITSIVLGDKGISEYYYSQFFIPAILANALPARNPTLIPSRIPTRNPIAPLTRSTTKYPICMGSTNKPTK